MGVFRAVSRPVYEELVEQQIAQARQRAGAEPDLGALLRSGETWEVS
jgi:2-oxoglutarate ferredoxin oxidoreductase subunit beta